MSNHSGLLPVITLIPLRIPYSYSRGKIAKTPSFLPLHLCTHLFHKHPIGFEFGKSGLQFGDPGLTPDCYFGLDCQPLLSLQEKLLCCTQASD
jgi:hypothetical protein